MLNGVMLLWFVLTAMALGFVAIDIREAPVPPVMKWGFVLLTAYTGPMVHSFTSWDAANRYAVSMSAIFPHAGARYSGPPCTA